MFVVTAHQPNYLPGLSIIEKIGSADACIWLDEVQFTHGGWSNRNRMPDGSWLTVPLERKADRGILTEPSCTGDGLCRVCCDRGVDRCYAERHGGHAPMLPFNRVRISEHGDWRRAHIKTLRQHYGAEAARICDEIERPYGLLVGLSLACLAVILDGCRTSWHFQSHLDGGRAVVAVSEDRAELAPISVRLAMMVEELGGDVYLSGPSGYRYLDEQPFHDRGINVQYWEYSGPNLCSMELLAQSSIR